MTSSKNECSSMAPRSWWRLGCSCVLFRLTCDSTRTFASSTSVPLSPGIPDKQVGAETKHKRLDVDFSGRIETHVVGSDNTERHLRSNRHQPLVSLDLPLGNPSLYVAADYDFAKCRYGATLISTTLRFVLPSNLATAVRQRISRFHRDEQVRRPLKLDVTLERRFAPGVAGERPTGTIWSLRWPWLSGPESDHPARNDRQQQQPDELVLQWKPSQELSLSVPLHRRIRWHGTLLLSHTNDRSRFPRMNGGTNEATDHDWWIPTVRVDALGQMVSTNEVCWPNGVNVKLSVSRRVNWGVLGGLLPHETAETTRVRLRVDGLLGPGTTMNSIALESVLEQPLQSARVLVQQQRTAGS